MNWEHTELSLAPRAGRIDELRSEAASHRQYREVMRAQRPRRSFSLRSRLAKWFAALSDLVAPSERTPASSRSTE